MAVRAKDIAKEIGVSEATISLVINGKPGVSDKTRSKVVTKIRELGYGYLLQGEGVANQKLRKIGFIVYKDEGQLLGENSFFPLILDGIETTAREFGFSVVVVHINKKQLDEDIRYVKELDCVGCVVFATEMQETEVLSLKKLDMPIVILDNYFINYNIACIKLNNAQGEHVAVKYLYEMGHRKIGYLGSGLKINSFEERQKCALEAMERMGLTGMERFFYKIGYPNEEAEEGMQRILRQHVRDELPTAFVSDNDLVAAGAIRAFENFGYKIPDDFSIIGYDDRPICTLVNPKITTIEIPRNLFGAIAVRKLARIILYNEEYNTVTSLNGTLVVRDTVKKLE